VDEDEGTPALSTHASICPLSADGSQIGTKALTVTVRVSAAPADGAVIVVDFGWIFPVTHCVQAMSVRTESAT
jgi:hypothetical protein